MSAVRTATFRRWSWLAIAALILVSLVRAGVEEGPPTTAAARVEAIAGTLKCPTCRSQSVADSDSPAARAIRTEIAKRVEEGQPADEIRAAIEATFDDVQLIPRRSGIEGLVWILPVVALVLALAGLLAAFARWRRTPLVEASEADRLLVAEARAER